MAKKKKREPNNTDILLRLLRLKHCNDVFVSECKDGPSAQGMLKLDGWAMKRSWAHPMSIGYEIKQSRSDFVNDTKWHGYLDYCNELYFVTTPGIIKPSEIPESVGLLESSSNLTKLFTRKKAPYRDIEIPESFYRYILMCRVRITEPTFYYPGSHTSAREYWEHWIVQKEKDLHFGKYVSKKIRKEVEEKIINIERNQKELDDKINKLEDIKKICSEFGINTDNAGYMMKYTFERKLNDFNKIINDNFKSSLDYLRNDIEKVLKQINECEKNYKKSND